MTHSGINPEIMQLLIQMMAAQDTSFQLMNENGILLPQNLQETQSRAHATLKHLLEAQQYVLRKGHEIHLLVINEETNNGLIIPFGEVQEAIIRLQAAGAEQLSFYANVWLSLERDHLDLRTLHVHTGEPTFMFKEATFAQALPYVKMRQDLHTVTPGRPHPESHMVTVHRNGKLTLQWSHTQLHAQWPQVLHEAQSLTGHLMLFDESEVFYSATGRSKRHPGQNS